MNTTLFQIYLRFIWPKRQECERKHTFFFYLIIIYRQIIFRNNLILRGLASLVRLEYLTENSFGTQCKTGYNIAYSVQARVFFYFLWNKGQNVFPTKGGQIIYFIYKNCQTPPHFHRNGFEMYILIIIYTVCTCDTLVPTRILNSEISWFCFDFPKWGPVSFIITDFNAFVQFFE